MTGQCADMSAGSAYRSPIVLIFAAFAMVVVLLAPAHAATFVQTVGEPVVSHGHAPSTSVAMPHASHKGGGHDHSHDSLAYAPPPPPSVLPLVEHTCFRLPDTPIDMKRTPEHKPKA